MNGEAEKLNGVRSKIFYSMTARFLYLMKRSRPDLEPVVSFMINQISKCDEDERKNLKRGSVWANNAIEDKSVIGAINLSGVFT